MIVWFPAPTNIQAYPLGLCKEGESHQKYMDYTQRWQRAEHCISAQSQAKGEAMFWGDEYVSSSFPFEDFTSFYAINFWATYGENYPCKTDKVGSISMFLLGVCVNFLFLNEMLCKFKHIDE